MIHLTKGTLGVLFLLIRCLLLGNNGAACKTQLDFELEKACTYTKPLALELRSRSTGFQKRQAGFAAAAQPAGRKRASGGGGPTGAAGAAAGQEGVRPMGTRHGLEQWLSRYKRKRKAKLLDNALCPYRVDSFNKRHLGGTVFTYSLSFARK